MNSALPPVIAFGIKSVTAICWNGTVDSLFQGLFEEHSSFFLNIGCTGTDLYITNLANHGAYSGRGRGGGGGDYGYDDRYGGASYGRGRGHYDDYDGYARGDGYGRGDGAYSGRGRGGGGGDYGYDDRYAGGSYGRGRGHYDDYDGYARGDGYGRGDGFGRGDGYYRGGRGGFGGRGDGGYGRGGLGRGRGAAYYDDDRDYYNGDGPVMMIYGIDQENFNCDKMFNLLCLYGNCEKVNLLLFFPEKAAVIIGTHQVHKSKTDTAMAQMGTVRQVYTAIDNLHGTQAFGNRIALRPSKQQILHEIRDPFPLPDGTPSFRYLDCQINGRERCCFREYINSRNQRYSTPELAARNRIVKPTNVLHWYNAPVTMTEEKLREVLSFRPNSTKYWKLVNVP
ncbi:unnamed protein product [Gongylonema pulchrum]|uniref:RRM domain-containing protein n=1 Tax=Gongylonema pulchrum TaxID=637853 RepID=A0A183EIF2_9BILA|nr:unnamed protein product [Gongylonema pulchrum]